jgi:hypothetical protein
MNKIMKLEQEISRSCLFLDLKYIAASGNANGLMMEINFISALWKSYVPK